VAAHYPLIAKHAWTRKHPTGQISQPRLTRLVPRAPTIKAQSVCMSTPNPATPPNPGSDRSRAE
jgi:hypothetical protein